MPPADQIADVLLCVQRRHGRRSDISLHRLDQGPTRSVDPAREVPIVAVEAGVEPEEVGPDRPNRQEQGGEEQEEKGEAPIVPLRILATRLVQDVGERIDVVFVEPECVVSQCGNGG